MSRPSKALLADILNVLVLEWGGEAVLRELLQIIKPAPRDEVPTPRHSVENRTSKTRKTKISSAVQQVEAIKGLDGELRRPLLLIAEKYDQRKFLPTLIDAKEFLAMRGVGRPVIKNRLRGFRLFLNLAREMPLEALEDLATTSNYSGPSELAPLSSAIKAAGDSRREKSPAEKADEENAQSSTTNISGKP